MLIYMTVLLYGQMIGRSVVVEKTSKTVEIMLSSVRPVELLFGKILGKGFAGLPPVRDLGRGRASAHQSRRTLP